MAPGKSYQEARAALPEELREPFDHLVEDYKFNAAKVHGSRMYSPKVLAELIKAGWRLEGDQ